MKVITAQTGRFVFNDGVWWRVVSRRHYAPGAYVVTLDPAYYVVDPSEEQ